MPQWSPGYYGIGDYSRNVSNFRAEDASGHALAWEKVTKNTWRVVADNAPAIVLNYDVFGTIVVRGQYLPGRRSRDIFRHPACSCTSRDNCSIR